MQKVAQSSGEVGHLETSVDATTNVLSYTKRLVQTKV